MRTHFAHAARAVALGALVLAVSRPLFAEETTDTVGSLREQIRSLDQKLRILERRAELEEEARAATAKSQPVVTAGAGGFSIASPDKSYELRIRANVQADARLHLGDGSADTFLLRRVRPSLEGTLAGRFGFRVMPDFAGSSTTLVDAYASYRYSPALSIQAGKFKVPFDLERLVSQTDLPFVERSYTTALSPNRDNGIHVFGDLVEGKLSYNLAWVNGTADGGTSVSDDDSDKEIVARVFAHPFKSGASALKGLGLGLALTTGGKTSFSPAGYRTNAQQSWFAWRSSVRSTGTQTRFEPQATFYHGPLGLMAAWVSSRQDLTNGAASAEIDNKGWFVAASFVLTGEAATYTSLRPAHEFDPARGQWGAWEIAARIAELDIDDDAFPAFADPASSASKVTSTTLGLNWYLNRNIKLVLNWEHSSFDGGDSGAITGHDEDAILTRAQLRF